MSNKQYPGTPSPSQINEMQDAGFTVHMVYDGDPALYAWMNTKSEETQANYRTVQPYRRTKAQAWADCYAYHSLEMPTSPEPDWDAKARP